jgi:hypothetical protein
MIFINTLILHPSTISLACCLVLSDQHPSGR